MRLLRTTDPYKYKIETFNQINVPPYAILSHVWDKEEEVTFADIQDIDEAKKHKGWTKISQFCAIAEKDGYQWGWDDTCCIDKTSSAELSETINSMYAWYCNASRCYAYLSDVKDAAEENPTEEDSSFRNSQWFLRGWTLQELIAPKVVFLLSKNWRRLGTKRSLARVIEETTAVPRDVLTGEKPLDEISIARRMSWAAARKTTREEDQAYSLMGIFGVNMPAIYGEGAKAFIRLQLEIIQQSSDQSIFAWGTVHHHETLKDNKQSFTESPPFSTDFRSLLATTPGMFTNSANIEPLSVEELAQRVQVDIPVPEFYLTNYGISIHLPVFPISKSGKVCFALLACQSDGAVVGLLLCRADGSANRYRVGMNRLNLPPVQPWHPYFRTFVFTQKQYQALSPRVMRLYLHGYNANPQRSQEIGVEDGALRIHGLNLGSSSLPKRFNFILQGWLLQKLRDVGFTVTGFSPEPVSQAQPLTQAGLAPRSLWNPRETDGVTLSLNPLPVDDLAFGPEPERHGIIVFRGPQQAVFVVAIGAFYSEEIWSFVMLKGITGRSVVPAEETLWQGSDYEIAARLYCTCQRSLKDPAKIGNLKKETLKGTNGSRTFGNSRVGRVRITITPWMTDGEAASISQTSQTQTVVITHDVRLEVEFGEAKVWDSDEVEKDKDISAMSSRVVTVTTS